MDKWVKTISRLSPNLRKKVKETIQLILLNHISALDIKKLKGVENIFRIRIGKIRIIFSKHDNKNKIIGVCFRDNTTYNKLH